MNIIGFNDQQKQTLLDLLIIGMYADGNLKDAEEKQVESVLATMKFSSETEREQCLDACFTRARQHLDSTQSTQTFVADIAGHFPTSDLRRKAYDDLEELLRSDGEIDDKESRFLAEVKEGFKL